MENKKVVMIIPAFNEESTITNSIIPGLKSPSIDEVIVVSDGSTDHTAEVARQAGATVIENDENIGKGGAMFKAVNSTDADIVLFVDADLIGLTVDHIESLVQPLIKGTHGMCIGLRSRWRGFMYIYPYIMPSLVIGGERALRREMFLAIPAKHREGYKIETALNVYAIRHNIPICYKRLENLDMVIKEKKLGLIKGFIARIKMFFSVFKIRIYLIFKKD